MVARDVNSRFYNDVCGFLNMHYSEAVVWARRLVVYEAASYVYVLSGAGASMDVGMWQDSASGNVLGSEKAKSLLN